MTDGNDTQETSGAAGDAHVRASSIIDRFGGIRPMAGKLGVAVSTVQGWRQRNTIPASRLEQIRAAAVAHDIELSNSDFAPIAAAPTEPTSAEAGPLHRPVIAPPPPLPTARATWVLPALALIVAVGAVVYAAWIGARAPTEGSGQTAALEARMATLEQNPPVGAGARLDGIEQRATALAGRVDELAMTPRLPPDAEARLATLEGAMPRMTAQVEAVVDRPAQMTARLAEIEDGLGALAQRQSEQAGNAAASNVETVATVAALQRSIAALRTDMESLQAEFEELNAAAHGADAATASAVGLAMAAGQLRAAIATTRPYTEALAAVRTAAVHDAALEAKLAPLAPTAGTGVADLAKLRQDFVTVAREIVVAARGAEDGDWVDRTLARAASLVSVRRVGADVEGDDAAAIVARAEAALERGNIVAAVDELDSLSGTVADAAGPWLVSAHAQIAAEQALGALDDAVRAALDNAG